MNAKTAAGIVVAALVVWFAWMGVQTLNQVEAAQAKRAAQIEALTR